MSVTEKLNYDQIRDYALRLSPMERFRLARELRMYHEEPDSSDKPNLTLLWKQGELCCYHVGEISPEEVEEARRKHERLEAEREKMTPEEIKQRKEQRKESMRRADEALAQIPDEVIQEYVEIWRAYGLCE
jgi:hypothetical protein